MTATTIFYFDSWVALVFTNAPIKQRFIATSALSDLPSGGHFEVAANEAVNPVPKFYVTIKKLAAQHEVA